VEAGKHHVRVEAELRQRKASAVLRENCRTVGLCISLQIEVSWSRNLMRNFTSLVRLSAVAAGDPAAPGIQLANE
jgi:hypothetical protein